MTRRSPISLATLLLLAAACAGRTSTTTPSTTPASPAAAATAAHPADEFFARLAEHCGQAFAGRIGADEPRQQSDPFAGQPPVMHVRECGAKEIKVPFHIGEDRSRTWALTRTDGGLRLGHEHRHADSKEDAVTLYGGDTVAPGTAARQEFPANAFSKGLFARQDRAVSMTNTWAMEIESRKRFIYELARPGRLFRVEFDLSQPVAPPPPWGHPVTEQAPGRAWLR